MRIIRTIARWRGLQKAHARKGLTLGFVPTMGALHAGHVSLVKKSAAENDRTLASIFVNPTQFDDPRDLENYPRALERDAKLLAASGADYLLAPEYGELYPDGYRYRVQETVDSKLLCGAHRPDHFDGVLTVVLKLLHIAGARRAYFGEKDYQQYLLIKGLAEAFFLDTEIIPCPTVREADGLAMSSRNMLLTPEQRAAAPQFHTALSAGKNTAAIRRLLARKGFSVDYVAEKYGRRFGAVRAGKVRLIDNVKI
ncbi:MAG: pantoate--beta-alanine ligase [Elusimicrobiales bacterium]|nr:pantoate--beta-alanine ligase [Elusimicrobiales bacterium]